LGLEKEDEIPPPGTRRRHGKRDVSSWTREVKRRLDSEGFLKPLFSSTKFSDLRD